jgi:hypothetical protein
MATETATEAVGGSALGRRRSGRERAGVLARSPFAQWGAFSLVHIVLWLCALLGDGMPLGDVIIVYQPWAQLAQHGYAFMGVTAPWVYPVLAMVPVLIPLLAGPGGYVIGWLTMVTAFDIAAFAVLTLRGRRRAVIAAWWWLGFLLLLGPIAVGRLDGVSVSIAIVAAAWLAARPRVAAVLLAAATWIKVWPAGMILAVMIAMRRRWRVLSWALFTSVVIGIVVVASGGATDLFSFVTQQTRRGLQIEAPISTPWVWAAALHLEGGTVYYDPDLLTFEVTGRWIDEATSAMTPVLAIAVLAVSLLGVRAVLRKAPSLIVLPQLALAVVTTLIAFNKVGSPQYIDWLAAPVILGIITSGRRFRRPAVLVAVTAALTQLFYPYLYLQVLYLNAWMLAIVTARNVMLFVVLGWAVMALWRSGNVPERLAPPSEPVMAAGTPGRSVWPLAEPPTSTAPGPGQSAATSYAPTAPASQGAPTAPVPTSAPGPAPQD